MAYLHENKEEFANAVNLASEYFRVLPIIVEKDYYVTMILRELSKRLGFVVFKGGNVYVSSDAKKPAAKRGRSTCKITIINTRSWGIHAYHLISTDGKKVYGWVDKSNIEGLPTSSTNSKTNSGTKQTTSGNSKAVYHKVKKGNTIWTLVNKNYKSLGKSVNWVISNNPNAFSKKGDPKTLKVGVKLLMGYKS